MRFVLALLVIAACKDKAPPTITDLADQMCACKDAACRDEVAVKVVRLSSELSPEQIEAHVKDVERIDNCAKSIATETR